jgi:hypothetical protein
VELVELRTSIIHGQHIHRQRLGAALTDVFLAIKQIIQASHNLSEGEKADLFRSLSAIPVTVDRPNGTKLRKTSAAPAEA